MVKKIRVYISSPITIDKEHYQDNFDKYEKAINELSYTTDDGITVYPYEAVNPIKYKQDCYKTNDNDSDKFADGAWEKFIMKDIELLSTCDEIALFPGWEKSYGCTIEYLCARRMRKHVVFGKDGNTEYDFTLAHLIDFWSDSIMKGADKINIQNSRFDELLKDKINELAEEKKKELVILDKDSDVKYYIQKGSINLYQYTVYDKNSNTYIRCNAFRERTFILKGSELKEFKHQRFVKEQVEISSRLICKPELYKKALKKEPISNNDQFKIGDIVSPNEKAIKRNKEFTTDKKFIIIGEQDNVPFNENEPIWYDLSAKGSKTATYCLPANELTLIKRTALDEY